MPRLGGNWQSGYERVATVQGFPFGANLGDTQGATLSFRKAAVIWDCLSHANPSDIQDLLGLAGNYRQLAGMLANGGGGDPLEAMQKSVEIAERTEGFASSDLRVAEELVLDYEMEGQIQTRTGGDPAGALENFRKGLTIAEQRLRSSPQDRNLQRRVARIHVLMGDALADLGEREEALEHSRLGLTIFGSGPRDAHLQRLVALTHFKRGDILMMNGDAAGALQSYRQEQTLLEPLATADPQNAQLRGELATAYARVGHALSQIGNRSGALAMLEHAVGMLELLARDPQHTEARAELARGHIWTGDLLAKTGQSSAALQSYRKGTADFVGVTATLPWDRYVLLGCATISLDSYRS